MNSFDFLSEGCAAGQTLVRLVSRGNAILAELLRLSQNIPPTFKLSTNPKEHKDATFSKYTNILFDFRYLKNTDLYEDRVEKNLTLRELDAEFRESHMDILRRFYLLFESIYKYAVDFDRYIDDLNEGVFIQLTLDLVLLNPDGKQLMTECLYLFGVMLILMDELIEGTVRERLLISYLRYKDQSENPLIEKVCQLFSKTGKIPGQKVPAKYPISYFKRFPLPKEVIAMIIGRLRTDDIYNQVRAYPRPEHRSTALSTQASMLYIILYFAPDILESEQAAMREIVDKHFSDNWVISYYLGYMADLSAVWRVYPAAAAALGNTLQGSNIMKHSRFYNSEVAKQVKRLNQLLTEGILTKNFILERNPMLMDVCRECNVTIRWLILHTQTQNAKIREIILKDFDKHKLLIFILKCAQFEFLLKTTYQNILDSKEDRWTVCRSESSDRMKELSEYFSGEKALTRVKKNESLRAWFATISEKVLGLDFFDSTLAGRKLQQLMIALEEVEQFHQIETNLQVQQFLKDTRAFLAQMMNIVNIKGEYLGILAIVSDMSYAWQLIRDFVPRMQDQIKRDPSSVIMLRSTFLKLSSILDLPLVRINQAKSPDLISVSEYYSSELVKFVRKVLAIVPRSMFVILNEIIDIQTNQLPVLATKIEKETIITTAQLKVRHKLAKATYAISVFTEGMLAMENTLVGVIELDPKQLLEDGIRKELVKRIASTMNNILVIRTNNPDELPKKLNELADKLEGYRRSFQYIQDYVNIYGLKIWQEEFSRIINYNVEQECNSFLKKKVYDHQSAFQSEAIPIPKFPRVGDSVNFIGRLAREIIRQTSYQTTTYLDQMSGWFDPRGRELVGIRTFTLLNNSVSVFGVTGLDKLYCFMIIKKLQDIVILCRNQLKTIGGYFDKVGKELHPTATIPNSADRIYSEALRSTTSLFEQLIPSVSRVGQMQLIRKHIASNLNFSAKIDSKTLFYSLDAMNSALLIDVEAHYKNPETKPYPDSDENPLLAELSDYLETVGITDPLTRIYITTKPIKFFPMFMFLLFLTLSSRFHYNKTLSILVPNALRKKGGIDSTPVIVGFITLLKQFHSTHTQKFLAYVGQYIRANINLVPKNPKLIDLPKDVRELLIFLEVLCEYSDSINRGDLEVYIPPYILDNFTHL